MRSDQAVILLIAQDLLLMAFLGQWFFESFDDFLSALWYAIKPDWLSRWVSGDYERDFVQTAKLTFPVWIIGMINVVEYIAWEHGLQTLSVTLPAFALIAGWHWVIYKALFRGWEDFLSCWYSSDKPRDLLLGGFDDAFGDFGPRLRMMAASMLAALSYLGAAMVLDRFGWL